MIPEIIDLVSDGIQITAVLIIVGGIVNAARHYVIERGGEARLAYKPFKDRIGGAMMLGLEFLVAADVVDTVTTKPTMQSIATLGLLVVVRTFLSWSLVVEIEGRWPWRAREARGE